MLFIADDEMITEIDRRDQSIIEIYQRDQPIRMINQRDQQIMVIDQRDHSIRERLLGAISRSERSVCADQLMTGIEQSNQPPKIINEHDQ